MPAGNSLMRPSSGSSNADGLASAANNARADACRHVSRPPNSISHNAASGMLSATIVNADLANAATS
jgi:hypothetical protein